MSGGEGFYLGNVRDPDNAPTIGYVGPKASLYVVAKDGRYEILDPAARKFLGCRVGSISYPLRLCAGDESTGLLAHH